MQRDRHTVGEADLFNDQVGKIGKNRHRLILDQEMITLEILFGPLFYHIAIIEAAEEPYFCRISVAYPGSMLASLRIEMKLFPRLWPQISHSYC